MGSCSAYNRLKKVHMLYFKVFHQQVLRSVVSPITNYKDKAKAQKLCMSGMFQVIWHTM